MRARTPPIATLHRPSRQAWSPSCAHADICLRISRFATVAAHGVLTILRIARARVNGLFPRDKRTREHLGCDGTSWEQRTFLRLSCARDTPTDTPPPHTTVTHRATHAVHAAFAPPCTRVTHGDRPPVCRARHPTAQYQRTSLRRALTIHHDCRAHRLLRDNAWRPSDVVRCIHLSVRAHTCSSTHPVRTGCNAARADPSHRFARRSRIPRVVVHAPPYASASRRE